MVVTNPTHLSLPSLRVLFVRRLPRPGRGVKTDLQPRPALSSQLTAKSRRFRTSAKHVSNLFGIRTSKTQDLKVFRMTTYKKTGEGVAEISVSAPCPYTPSRGQGASYVCATRRNPRNPNLFMGLLHNSRTPGGGGYDRRSGFDFQPPTPSSKPKGGHTTPSCQKC
jgi:hypothetical protein